VSARITRSKDELARIVEILEAAVPPGREELIQRVVEILDSDDYDTSEEMAFAMLEVAGAVQQTNEQTAYQVLKEAAAILTERHLFVVWSRRYPEVGWGPYYTEAQAKEAWLGSIGPALGQEGGGIIPIAPWDVTPLVSGVELATDKCVCGHARWRHTTEGRRLYCGPSAKRTKDPCNCSGGFTDPNRKG
jgi:hypothetical protein